MLRPAETRCIIQLALGLTAGERGVEAGEFDPRTYAWYQAAVEARGPIFSPYTSISR